MANPFLFLAQQYIQKHRDQIPNTPWAYAAVNAIMNGDEQTGSKIADNLCQSYGMTKEQVLQQASQEVMGMLNNKR